MPTAERKKRSPRIQVKIARLQYPGNQTPAEVYVLGKGSVQYYAEVQGYPDTWQIGRSIEGAVRQILFSEPERFPPGTPIHILFDLEDDFTRKLFYGDISFAEVVQPLTEVLEATTSAHKPSSPSLLLDPGPVKGGK